MGLASPGSSGTLHPATLAFPSMGSLPGGMIVAEIRQCGDPLEEPAHSVFCHENMHGSRMVESAMATVTAYGVTAGDRAGVWLNFGRSWPNLCLTPLRSSQVAAPDTGKPAETVLCSSPCERATL